MTDLARTEPGTLARRDELTIEDMLDQVQKVQQLMARVMKDGEHYGVIPGTKKPSLLKPGAEKLCLLFRLDPQYADPPRIEKDGQHITVVSTVTLYHILTGQRWGSGQGSCSTKESKYAWRQGSRTCPKCGKEDTIIKGRKEYGGGWLCFAKKGGCGEKFKDDDTAITGQNTERVPNEDLADVYNTILKMANKRALVAAVLNVTAASDIFTQDLEDMPHMGTVTQPTPARVIDADPEKDEAATLLPTPEDDRAYYLAKLQDYIKRDKVTPAERDAIKRAHFGSETADMQRVDITALMDLYKGWDTALAGMRKGKKA